MAWAERAVPASAAAPLRVLFLVHRYTDDGANGLCLRMHNLVRHLDRGAIEPFLLTVNAMEINADNVSALFAGHAHERLDELQFGRIERLRNAATLAPWALYRAYPGLTDTVQRHCERWGIDVVVETGGFLIANLDPARLRAALVCDLIDSPAVFRLRDLQASSSWHGRLRDRYRLAASRAYQRRCLSRALFVSVTSEVDAREVVQSNPELSVMVLSNGVDVDYFRPGPAGATPVDLAFEGDMSYIPNVDAACHLVGDILPELRAQRPQATVAIVGKNPAPAVRALAGPGVHVTGTVADVRPHVRAARVFACPMRLGAGIKNKILQAWSMGVPVVATSASLAGLDAEPGRHLLIADDARGFAQAVLSLLDDPERAATIARAARAHVTEGFSWQSRSAAFAEAIGRAAAARAR